METRPAEHIKDKVLNLSQTDSLDFILATTVAEKTQSSADPHHLCWQGTTQMIQNRFQVHTSELLLL